MKKGSIRDQLRKNTVALISLAVAITGLGYNTWRNEHSERNRNLRFASFELLLKLGELEDLVFVNFWDCDSTLRGSPRTGWSLVRTIGDLALILDEDGMPQHVATLQNVWEDNWQALEFDSVGACEAVHADSETYKAAETRVLAIRDAIDMLRSDARDVLYDLE